MTTTIEIKFFELYQRGSVADSCLFYLRWKYDIREYRTKNGWLLTDAGAKNIEELPAKLFAAATNIDFSAEEVIEEIRGNVDTLEQNAAKLYRYLRHDVIKLLKYISEQSELIGSIKCSLDLLHPLTEGIEAFNILFDLLDEFINRLDALLLEYGIDLMELQKECGITLKQGRNIEDIAPYIGTPELTQRYIDALAQCCTAVADPNGQQSIRSQSGYDVQPFEVPECLHTDEAEKMLKTLESVRGYKGKAVLYRGTTPWDVSAKSDWAYVAQELTKRLKLADRVDWLMWAKLIGTPRNTLRNASRSTYAAAGSNAILTALNELE